MAASYHGILEEEHKILSWFVVAITSMIKFDFMMSILRGINLLELLASGYDGGAYVWDMRLGNLPCLRLSTVWGYLNNIETDVEEQVLFWSSCDWLDPRMRYSRRKPNFSRMDNLPRVVTVIEDLARLMKGGGDFKMDFDGGIQSIRRPGVFGLHSETLTQIHYPTLNSDEKLIRPDDYKRRPAWMLENLVQVLGICHL
ncbi:hypothetical protein KSP40_PGU020015 [Platanthera guangdongensis]|uniref:Uncharacterized protein n=1 Tax=Platanthera guangdongensis TaxID=2320717 RepID=A0ABR2MGK2_9ASPA